MASQSFESNSLGFKFWLCSLLFSPSVHCTWECGVSHLWTGSCENKSVMRRGTNACKEERQGGACGFGADFKSTNSESWTLVPGCLPTSKPLTWSCPSFWKPLCLCEYVSLGFSGWSAIWLLWIKHLISSYCVATGLTFLIYKRGDPLNSHYNWAIHAG